MNMADIIFEITSRNGKQADGNLIWKDKGLDSAAVSGPYGNGYLPNGTYIAARNKMLDKPSGSPYCDKNDKCWMQPMDPNFSTSRTDLGIHPDGNVAGTQGCIGLKDKDTKPWYDAFYSVPRGMSVTVEVKDSTKSHETGPL
jgi:hypothetical protein